MCFMSDASYDSPSSDDRRDHSVEAAAEWAFALGRLRLRGQEERREPPSQKYKIQELVSFNNLQQ